MPKSNTNMTPSKSDKNIKIQITRHFRDINISTPKIGKLIKTVCKRFDKNEKTNPTKFEISVVIVDDTEFKKLNYQFLKKRAISDCLSFDLSDFEKSGSPKIFELVINGQMAQRQANLRKHSEQAELALYITHGLLHNFGFDDLKPSMAKIMHAKEDEILQELNYGLVYNTPIESKKLKTVIKRKHKK
ncbi:MAG: rRNA maturation RNase YbeY [Sedimentisphaerales bacterium]|nr:rRNA maturation RNase YbeY [Sedimentisphaerales bacterium]